MTKKQLHIFRARLIDMWRRLTRLRFENRDEAMRPIGGEADAGLSNVPIHPAELAFRQTSEYVALGIVENEEKLIAEVNQALARMDEGAFGRCAVCRQEIPIDRLEAAPYVRTCISCAATASADE